MFYPFAVEATGRIGERASLFIQHLAQQLDIPTGKRTLSMIASLQAQICTVVTKVNAMMTLNHLHNHSVAQVLPNLAVLMDAIAGD